MGTSKDGLFYYNLGFGEQQLIPNFQVITSRSQTPRDFPKQTRLNTTPVNELHEDYGLIYGPFFANRPKNGVPYRVGHLRRLVWMHDGDHAPLATLPWLPTLPNRKTVLRVYLTPELILDILAGLSNRTSSRLPDVEDIIRSDTASAG